MFIANWPIYVIDLLVVNNLDFMLVYCACFPGFGESYL